MTMCGRVGRSRIRARLTNVPQCLIGIEADMAIHHVARELIALGHDVRQPPPVYARPFRQTRVAIGGQDGHQSNFIANDQPT